MKRILVGLFLAASLSAIGKSVNESKARVVAGNYLKKMGISVLPPQLPVVYKATSDVGGTAVTDFYVFSNGTGFIIVSGDDLVEPVLAWSDDAPFNGINIPPHVAAWLEDYKVQINSVIGSNVPSAAAVANQWNELLKGTSSSIAAKTTGGIMRPLVKTKWGQGTYYNELCPFDVSAGELTITGCVATAMAQLMKYWNWPQSGVGSHSYYSPYGMLNANYGSHTYVWDSMPNTLARPNSYVATVMSDAGISVNMNYGVDGSGAWVIGSGNCTQAALPAYFQYKSTLKAEYRSSYSDLDWTELIKSEMDVKRPVIFTGYGPDGGHCWLADGYSSDSLIHFNWGWDNAYNGYYSVAKLAPGGSDFTDRQEILVNIEPDSGAVVGVSNVDTYNDNKQLVYPNPANEVVNIVLQANTVTAIRILDVAGRIVKTITTDKKETTVTIPVANMQPGIYVVELQGIGVTERRKITIVR